MDAEANSVIQCSVMALVVKNLPPRARDVRDVGSIPGLGRSPGRGHGNPLQCSCLRSPMDSSYYIPALYELGGLQSIGSQRVEHD